MTSREAADALCVVDEARRLRERCEREGMGGALFAPLFAALDAYDMTAAGEGRCRNEDCHHAQEETARGHAGGLILRWSERSSFEEPPTAPAHLRRGTGPDGCPNAFTATCTADDVDKDPTP